MIKIGRFKVDETKLFLRTSNNGETTYGFRAKPLGQWNDSGDKWTGIPDCDKCCGFFGIDREANGFGLSIRMTLELCEWRGERVVIHGNKICVKSFRVLSTNSNIPKELVELAGGHLVEDGEDVESGENNVAIDVDFTQSDGTCLMHGKSVNNQHGGSCVMGGCSTNNQSGGYCHMRYNSSNKQSGGLCVMYDNSSNNYSGGCCRVYSKNAICKKVPEVKDG